MGGHYGSIHVKTEDRSRVKAAAETVAAAMRIKLLVGPTLNGWIGLYPESHGQDDAVSKAIAGHLRDTLLHLMVHDDDIFAYWLYADGRLIDSFWSLPGYFGDENLAAEEKMAGNPEAFRPILAERTHLLLPLLDRQAKQPVFASERLDEFAKLLGIPNAVTAYEYVKGGERDDILEWRKFEEVPAGVVASERKQKRREASATNAERDKLIADGAMLLDDQRKEAMPMGCALAQAFFVAWPEHFRGRVSFSRYEKPWSGPLALGLDVPAHITGVAADVTGRRVAMAAGSCVRVWDIDEPADSWRVVADIPESDLAVGVALSGDGRIVAHLSRNYLYVTDVETGGRICEFPGVHGQKMAFHPSGKWLALAGNTLAIVELGEKPRAFDLYVGGRSSLAAHIEAIVQSRVKAIDPEAFKKRQREVIEAAIAKLKKMLPPEKLAAVRNKMEAEIEQGLAKLLGAAQGAKTSVAQQPNERPNCVGFSRDGKQIWCGTDIGLRVYNWSDVPRETSADTPPPAWQFQMPGETPPTGSTYVYAIAEERSASAIVFGGSTGRIYRMSLDTGRVAQLAKLPGDVWIHDLHYSRDGQTLGVASRTNPVRAQRHQPQDERSAWQIWSTASK